MGMQVFGVPPGDLCWVSPVFQRDSIYRNMAAIFRALWFCITGLLLLLHRFIREHVRRIAGDVGSQKRCSDSPSTEGSKHLRPEFDDIFYETHHEMEEEGEQEKFKFEFRFSFQNPKSIRTDREETEFKFSFQDHESIRTNTEETAPDVTINNYRFLPERHLSGFIQEPKIMSLCIKESYVSDERSDELSALSNREKIDRELKERLSLMKASEQSDSDEEEKSVVSERPKSVDSFEWKEAPGEYLDIIEEIDSDVCLRSERDIVGFSSLGSPSGSDGYSVKDLLLGYGSDDILSERELDDQNYEEVHLETSRNSSCLEHLDMNPGFDNSVNDLNSSEEVEQLLEEINSETWGSEEVGSSLLDEGLEDLSRDRVSFFTDQNEILGYSDRPFYLESDSDVENSEADEVALEDSIDINSLVRHSVRDMGEESFHDLEIIMKDLNLKCPGKQDDLTALDLKKLEDSDEEEEEDELESLWEHQDLIDQLKMEINKAKATRLPTILEESETFRTEDLKPWKTDAKFLQENPMDELHKFYKSYRERMRKLDILSYQKMYAIGFLQLKDPLQSIGTGKQTFTSLFAENLWPCLRRKSKNDPTEKFLRELQGDLETVYVGQVCLSWEFLWWQYEKSQELPESDARGGRQYNQVAGEFQQFQVIIQRFLEDEPFQGARVPHYVKTRCTLRNLLQVPLIKEESKKDKMEDVKKGTKAITCEELNYIMEKSIRILWHFIKTDKDETPLIIKGLVRNRAELQYPTDHELMADIQANLRKKEKKLGDLLRVGNCLVKKFKKPQEQRLSKDLFCSQVDMKLVSRVLEMSRITTEQLVWCHKKLSKITFSDRKLHREPSFLLFPC